MCSCSFKSVLYRPVHVHTLLRRMRVFILAEPLSHYISLRLCFSIALESIYGDRLIDAHYILYNFATMHDLIILESLHIEQ